MSSLFLVYLLCSGAGDVISSYFLILKKLSNVLALAMALHF
jgi:hypothetical protein